MSSFPDYEQYDAAGLAQLIRNKEVSSTEVVEAAIERIEKYNPELNAVITKLYDQALDQTIRGIPDGPLAAVQEALAAVQHVLLRAACCQQRMLLTVLDQFVFQQAIVDCSD